jgi:hypothetical protein
MAFSVTWIGKRRLHAIALGKLMTYDHFLVKKLSLQISYGEGISLPNFSDGF